MASGVHLIAAASRLGILGIIVPKNNAQEATVVKELSVYGFQDLEEMVRFLDCLEKYQQQIVYNVVIDSFLLCRLDVICSIKYKIWFIWKKKDICIYCESN